MKHVPARRSLCAFALVAAVLAAPAAAEPPWQRLFKRVEADPNQSYTLTEDQGPWMIMAYTFTGDSAAADAKQLATELRSQHRLPAYTHEMVFDFQGGTIGNGVDRYGAARKMKYRVAKSQEIAVLVGEFPTLDDPQAKKMLERIRHLHPDCLAHNGATGESWQRGDRTIKGWRALQLALLGEETSKQLGPMAHAFIVSNPKIPEGYFKPKGVDKFVLEMNRSKKIKHSLLACPGKYTVRVATFAPPPIPIIGEDKQREAEAARLLDGTLEEAADKAHRLCEALRADGYEAYEFHDRHSSIVTIGSFDSVGSPRADGKIEINPQIHLLMSKFGAEKKIVPGQAPVVGQQKKMDSVGIKFDLQPMPVEVPKHTISGDYLSAGR
ncbi:MAG TPA: hypothetical protein VHZ24_21540 [Pirellulales bacterium]|jgi:hypothetical protein|nr:hypothetical protein [Pirellulales bacterium]